MSRDPAPLKPASTAIRAGRRASGASLAPALWASSVWESGSMDDAHRRAISLRADEFYGRYANPTVRSFEEVIAELEGAEDSMAFASGMGAIASTVLALCSAGDHIVAARQLYAGTLAFLQGPCARFGIGVTFVDGTVPGAIAAAVRPGRTMMVLAETPSNPRLELCDLDELGAIIGPVHGRRFDVRHTARPATPGARRRSGVALGDQGHRRAQRRHDRRDRRREGAGRHDLGLRRAARCDGVTVRCPQRPAR